MSKEVLKIQMVLERETKGALLYKEIDAQGNQIQSMYDCKIGNMYIRKSAFKPGADYPEVITVTVGD